MGEIDLFPRPQPLGAVPMRPHRTIDGVTLLPGVELHCRAQLVSPRARVRVLAQHRTTQSWLDGVLVTLWVVEDTESRARYVVEPWMLSEAPVRSVLDELAARRAHH